MRVVLCCAALGGAVGVCLAFVAEHISEHYERVLIEEEMSAEMDTQIDQHGKDADAELPRSAWKSVYIDRRGHAPTSPLALRSLPPGIHELKDVADSDRFAAIRIAPIGRVTMVAGLPNSPARERRFAEELLAMILLGIVLGGWLGRMLAGGMLAPVLRLSHEVDKGESGAELQRIASDHPGDEVGALANALIRHRERTTLAIEREVLFSADASHELRTPLSVLQGALDLLREGQGQTTPGQRRIDRIRRSAAEIANLLDALLLIARSEETADAVDATVDLAPALAAVVAEFREELGAAQIGIRLRCPNDARIRAPAELLRVALRLLFRSIASGAYGTDLRIDADTRGITLAAADAAAVAVGALASSTTVRNDTLQVAGNAVRAEAANTDPAHQHPEGRRSDELGGVGMLRRLCERYGWTLDVADDMAQPVLLSLRFRRPGRPSPDAAGSSSAQRGQAGST